MEEDYTSVIEMTKHVEDGLKTAFASLPAHSIELIVNLPSPLEDLYWPLRYSWRDGKLYRVEDSIGGTRKLHEV